MPLTGSATAADLRRGWHDEASKSEESTAEQDYGRRPWDASCARNVVVGSIRMFCCLGRRRPGSLVFDATFLRLRRVRRNGSLGASPPPRLPTQDGYFGHGEVNAKIPVGRVWSTQQKMSADGTIGVSSTSRRSCLATVPTGRVQKSPLLGNPRSPLILDAVKFAQLGRPQGLQISWRKKEALAAIGW